MLFYSVSKKKGRFFCWRPGLYITALCANPQKNAFATKSSNKWDIWWLQRVSVYSSLLFKLQIARSLHWWHLTDTFLSSSCPRWRHRQKTNFGRTDCSGHSRPLFTWSHDLNLSRTWSANGTVQCGPGGGGRRLLVDRERERERERERPGPLGAHPKQAQPAVFAPPRNMRRNVRVKSVSLESTTSYFISKLALVSLPWPL